MKKLSIFTLIVCSVFAKSSFDLGYQTLEIDDPVIEEIIAHKGFERLKDLHQYGITHYNSDLEDYSRFEHSLGVYMLCKKAHVSKNEQIAALLHDASHTAFSHFGDFFFDTHGDDAWQDLHHEAYFEQIGLIDVFKKHHLSLADIHHKNTMYLALDGPLPYLCADRIDYNIQGALKKGLLTKKEASMIYDDLYFDRSDWTLSDLVLAEKLSLASIVMTENCWSCPRSYVSNMLLCSLVKKAISLGLLNEKAIVLSTDSAILEKLEASSDPYIQEGLLIIKNINDYLTEGLTYQIGYKCRALNPLIRNGDTKIPLTDLSKSYHEAFYAAKARAQKGYSFALTEKGQSKAIFFNNLTSKQCLF